MPRPRSGDTSPDGGLGDPNEPRSQRRSDHAGEHASQLAARQTGTHRRVAQPDEFDGRPGTRGRHRPETGDRSGAGWWGNAAWVGCADGKARRLEPSIEPLADRLPTGMGCGGPSETSPFRVIVDPQTGRSLGQAPWRVGMLRAYGNAIVPQAAAAFIAAAMPLLAEHLEH